MAVSQPSWVELVLLAWVLAAALAAAGCDRQEEGQEAVAWVNGEPIPFSTFWEEVKTRYNEVSDTSSSREEVLALLQKEVLSDLIRHRLLLQEAERRGIRVTERELEERIERIKKDYRDTPLRKQLIEHSLDFDEWRESVRENLVIEKLFQEVVKGAGGVSEEEIAAYYKGHPEEFLVPEAVRIQQIVVKNRSTAKKLLRYLRRGADFGTLARQYSISPERENSGRLGTFQRGELPEALEKAAFSTPTGKVGPMVETKHGFHLLKVTARVPPHVSSLEEVRKRIGRKLLLEKQEAFYRQWVEKLIRNSDIRVSAPLASLVVDAGPSPQSPIQDESNDEDH